MSTDGNPLVSVIVCVYNAGPYLRPSLLSVLEQTYRELEVLVVDDGSSDGCIDTIADLEDSRLRIFRQENGGKPSALNLGLENAKGEFYAVHDADDLSDPNRIAVQLSTMEQNPDVAAVFCGNDLILDDRRIAPLANAKDRDACRRDIAAYRMPAPDPTAMYRMSMVREMRYETSLPIVEGLDYVLRVGEKYPMLVAGECLYGYRVHLHSVTRRDPKLRDRLVREVLVRACDRRGGDPAMALLDLSRPSSASARNDNNIAAHFMDSVCDLRNRGRRWQAISTALHCSYLNILDTHYHKALVYALAPMPMVKMIRGRRESAFAPAT